MVLISGEGKSTLSLKQRVFLFLVSFLIVAFGQPAWAPALGIAASSIGFALFWAVTLDIDSNRMRFGLAVLWFALVQLIQLSWFISHPFLYIYGLYVVLSLIMGIQFGIVSLLVQPKRLNSTLQMLAIAGLWTLMEWSRLFIFSGFSFNPIGLLATSSIYSLQSASLLGVYGLSFWVLFVNLLALRAWANRNNFRQVSCWILILSIPYLYGFAQYTYHEKMLDKESQEGQALFKALLVQTAFPIEEAMNFTSFQEAVAYVEGEWKKILHTLKDKQDKSYDLIALPEYVVPYGTYAPVYRFEKVKEAFSEFFGPAGIKALPPLREPLAVKTGEAQEEESWLVTNAYWSQAIANIFNADLVVGLQDDQWVSDLEKQSFSSAFYFWPHGNQGLRYEKRVLLPMGEYIPFAFCREIAKSYGIYGSFTCGKEAKVFPGSKVPFGLSICYEETYGDLMRENREKGAEMLINLTSDVWYPGSKLPKQHFDHARLRTVECGIPLLRSCNTGITGAIDSLGRVVTILGDGTSKSEWIRDALSVEVPMYHYKTLYAKFGDSLIIGFSFLALLFFFKK